ncbi:hypothetical protein MAUB_54960 [Mycolicibacterium aubagnense]|uniref:Uncharacterized protein n=1 Tax=Mycolicibacterium aubagnense TaxID=319707 RepID=A0ABM7ILP7_9MYCO|nr:hypothetical protein MAUB_54960 [Mycolicibacterium aubagnense]
MSSFLYQLGHLLVRRRRWVIVASVGNVLPTHAAILALRGGGHRVEHHHWRALELAVWMIGAAVATLSVTERRRSLSGRQLRVGYGPSAEVGRCRFPGISRRR